MYLVAVMDWFSRYVLSWQLSNTLDTHFCLEALKEAFQENQPEFFHSDQGVQFTSLAFTSFLERRLVSISMSSKGRAFDNIFIERLWRSVKYEEIYIHDYTTVSQLWDGLHAYFRLYNCQRLHQSLGYCTPAEIYFSLQPIC